MPHGRSRPVNPVSLFRRPTPETPPRPCSRVRSRAGRKGRGNSRVRTDSRGSRANVPGKHPTNSARRGRTVRRDSSVRPSRGKTVRRGSSVSRDRTTVRRTRTVRRDRDGLRVRRGLRTKVTMRTRAAILRSSLRLRKADRSLVPYAPSVHPGGVFCRKSPVRAQKAGKQAENASKTP